MAVRSAGQSLSHQGANPIESAARRTHLRFQNDHGFWIFECASSFKHCRKLGQRDRLAVEVSGPIMIKTYPDFDITRTQMRMGFVPGNERRCASPVPDLVLRATCGEERDAHREK